MSFAWRDCRRINLRESNASTDASGVKMKQPIGPEVDAAPAAPLRRAVTDLARVEAGLAAPALRTLTFGALASRGCGSGGSFSSAWRFWAPSDDV